MLKRRPYLTMLQWSVLKIMIEDGGAPVRLAAKILGVSRREAVYAVRRSQLVPYNVRTENFRITPYNEAERCCAKCKVWKPLQDFAFDRHRKNFRMSVCKLCRLKPLPLEDFADYVDPGTHRKSAPPRPIVTNRELQDRRRARNKDITP